jgi:hypothetical protein
MKFLFSILFMCVCMSSCINGSKCDVVPNSGIYSNSVIVYEFTYKGHSYLEIKDTGSYGQGWVHNPDCPCFNQKKESDGLW